VSGVSRIAFQLTQGLESLGYAVDVLSLADVPRFVSGELRISSMLWKAHQVLLPRLDSYDIVHIHGPVPTFSDIAILVSALRFGSARPSIVYTHFSEIDLRGYGFFCEIYNRMHKNLARLTNHVLVSTPSYADALARYLPSERISVVPWGVDGTWYDGSVPKADRFTVLFVGQLRPYKGVETLLGAVESVDNIDVEIIGGGHEEGYYRDLAAGRGLKHVTFRGRVSDRELFDSYARAHVLVLPSTTRAEAFGLVLLEGMVAGCVPLVSQLPGVTDLVGDAGVSFPIGDKAALATLLTRLRDDRPLCGLYSSRARERARSFSWQRTFNLHHAVYQQLMAVRRFSMALQTDQDVAGSLKGLLHDAVTTLGASAGSVMLWEPQGQGLRVQASHGLSRGMWTDSVQPPGQGIAGFVASNNTALLLPEAFANASNRELTHFARRAHIRSSISVPITVRQRTLGVVNLSSFVDSRRFEDGDMHWLNTLARRAGDVLVKHTRPWRPGSVVMKGATN
jgi:rhamnosyl/mannosyltransferase